jgi:hypothetical protein
VTAEQAMAEEREEPPALAAAVEFLRDLLSNGPMLLDEIKDRAGASEHSWRTIQRAKAELAVSSSKEGFSDGKWRWQLEDDDDLDFG